MKKIRSGPYLCYGSSDYELAEIIESRCKIVFRGPHDQELDNLGFKKYADTVYVLEIDCKKAKHGFSVTTFCTYKGLKFQLSDILESGKYRIFPLEEAQRNFGNFQRHGYDPVYEVDENDIEEIWEERVPLDGFKFDCERIYYIKRKPD